MAEWWEHAGFNGPREVEVAKQKRQEPTKAKVLAPNFSKNHLGRLHDQLVECVLNFNDESTAPIGRAEVIGVLEMVKQHFINGWDKT